MQLQSGLSGLQLWNIEWLDLLTAYDGYSISYDAIGTPTNWYNTKAWNFTWQNGRQLAKATSGSTTISYTYDVAGIRDSKTVGSTVYSYLTQNGKVVQQSWNGNVMDFIYDENGRPYACIYKDALYYYVLNLQGDVIGLVNTSGAYVAKYAYDAWGRLLSGTGTMASTNPLRYRGYYYDNDTKLYYLGSRYYDPAVKRFINADGLVSTGQGFVGYNMYAYCLNAPTRYTDSEGAFAVADDIAVFSIAGIVAIVCYAFYSSATQQATPGISDKISETIESIGKGMHSCLERMQSSVANVTTRDIADDTYQRVSAATSRKYKSQYELHHIVAQNAPGASPARRILSILQISVNDTRNLVSLKTVLHRRLHTKSYYSWVNGIIVSAYRSGRGFANKRVRVITALAYIKRNLQLWNASIPG